MNNITALLLFVLISSGAYAQYNDTLYYKSGMARSVTVKEHDELYLWYEYRNKKDKLVTAKVSIANLDYFVIYNEYNELVYNSKTGYRKPESAEPETE